MERDFTYILYKNIKTQTNDIWRCKAIDDSDAMAQFYTWCAKNKIAGLILEIS